MKYELSRPSTKILIETDKIKLFLDGTEISIV